MLGRDRKMALTDSATFGRHLELKRNKTSLGGRVSLCAESGSSDEEKTDIEYEYSYSIDDKEGNDDFRYKFYAHTVQKHKSLPSPNCKAEECEFCSYTFDETPCSKGHVSFCDIDDIISQVKPVSENTKDDTKHVVGFNKPCLVRAKTDAGEMARRKPPICSIQEQVPVTNNLQKRSFKTAADAKPSWKERLKLAIKREVSRSSTPAPRSLGSANRRQSVSYDPDLEKSTTYIHGGGKNFSRANTSLTPVRTGLKHLQMNYTETNLENNQSVIFLDLLKTSHQQARVRDVNVRNIERRLEAQRGNPFYSTSFYENKNIPDPFHRQEKKCARSMVQKQYERQQKIRKTTDELHIGYKRTFLTIKSPSRAEVEQIGSRCRYLRCRIPAATDWSQDD